MKFVKTLLSAIIAAAISLSAVPAQAGAFYNVAVANLTTSSAAGVVNSKPRDLSVWLTNVDSGVSTKLGLNGDGNQWITTQRPDGRFRLSVTSAGKYPTVWWPGVYTPQSAGIIILREGAGPNCASQVTTTGCAYVSWNWEVQSARSVSGRVTERSGAVAAGVPVSVTRSDDPWARYGATTDGGGYYSIAVPPGPQTFSVTTGGVIDSVDKIVQMAGETVNIRRSSVPLAPSWVYSAASSKRLSVTWNAPLDNGGKDILGYTATASPGGQSCTTAQTGCVIEGVANNTTHTVSVVARNAVGTSSPATSNPVTPLDQVPSAPRDVRALPASKSAKVSWSQPAIGEGITGYKVTASPGGQICTTKDLSCTVTGLTNGVAYTFRVVASSTGGESPASDASAPVTPADVPSPPRDVTATPGKQSLTVFWNGSADNGGAAVTGYTATAMPGGRQCSTGPDGRQCSIGNLTRRAYTVTVTAQNRTGSSAPSAPSNEVTPLDDVPPAPNGITAAAGDKEASVSWSAPNAVPETITGYRVVSSPGGFTCTTKDLSCTVTGLRNGVDYTFRVTSSSSGGDSAASEPSAPVTPAGLPSSVRSVRADPGDRSVSVSWNAPSDDGGAPITGYTATAWPSGRACNTTEEMRQCAIGGLVNGQSYTVTVTARNRVGTSERSPGSIQVTPQAVLPPKKVAAARASLWKASSSKGRVIAKWSVPGASQVRLTWRQIGAGRKQSKTTAASGHMILRGPKGTLWQIKVVGTTATGDRVSSSKVFRIAR